jgi:sterol desaturase/sphingolipid hydroxylase (fatty acid hydroxylase superfamily)
MHFQLLNIFSDFYQMVLDGSIILKFMLPAYVSMILIEWGIYMYARRKEWNFKDGLANVIVSSMNLSFEMIMGVLLPLSINLWLYNHIRLFTIPDTWWGFLLVFLLHDFLYYVYHYVSHRTGFFWAVHQVHHSSEEFNFTVASRGFFLDGPLSVLFYGWMPILGCSIPQMLTVIVLTNLFGIFNHTRLIRRMGILDFILCTPSNHRVHHGTELKYIDKNYGQVLIIWDVLFGTFQREEEEPRYGLTKQIGTTNPIKIELSGVQWLWKQMKSATTVKDKLMYLVMPPGWSHTGNHQRTEDLTAKFQPQHAAQ